MSLYIAALDNVSFNSKITACFCEIGSASEEYIFRTVSKDRKPSLRRKNLSQNVPCVRVYGGV